MYEAKVHPLIPRERFVRRLLLHFAAALAVLSVSLALGMVGYEYFEHLPWRARHSWSLLRGIYNAVGPRVFTALSI